MTPAAVLARETAKARRIVHEEAMYVQLRAAGLTNGMQREWKFEDTRRWRFDFAWPDNNPLVAVECEGGLWTGGRHNTPTGMLGDMEKYNAASLKAWYVLRVSAEHIKSGQALAWIKQMVKPEVRGT